MMQARGIFFATLLATAAVPLVPSSSKAQAVVTIVKAPPLLPVYDQPPLPDVGYIWLPGYWAYDDVFGYFWVPGTWVLPPRPGLLWTPGYWAFEGDAYTFRPGYWAETVGFYGGVDYGFGYTGDGYRGGYWRGNTFFYNQYVTRITNIRVVNVYNEVIVRRPDATRVSFNGGPGGIRLRPTPEQVAFMHAPHVGPTPLQRQHFQAARQDPELRNQRNHGRPPFAATPRPAEFRPGGERAPEPPPGQHAPVAPRPVIGTPVPRPPGPQAEPPRRPPEPRPNAVRPPEDRPHPAEARPREERPPEPPHENEHRPGPHPEAPKPHPEPPRPHPEAPKPHPEPPRPHPEAPHPGPRPHPGPHPHPEEHHPH